MNFRLKKRPLRVDHFEGLDFHLRVDDNFPIYTKRIKRKNMISKFERSNKQDVIGCGAQYEVPAFENQAQVETSQKFNNDIGTCINYVNIHPTQCNEHINKIILKGGDHAQKAVGELQLIVQVPSKMSSENGFVSENTKISCDRIKNRHRDAKIIKTDQLRGAKVKVTLNEVPKSITVPKEASTSKKESVGKNTKRSCDITKNHHRDAKMNELDQVHDFKVRVTSNVAVKSTIVPKEASTSKKESVGKNSKKSCDRTKNRHCDAKINKASRFITVSKEASTIKRNKISKDNKFPCNLKQSSAKDAHNTNTTIYKQYSDTYGKLSRKRPEPNFGKNSILDSKRMKSDSVRDSKQIAVKEIDVTEKNDNTHPNWKRFKVKNYKEAVAMIKQQWGIKKLSNPHVNRTYSAKNNNNNNKAPLRKEKLTSCFKIFNNQMSEINKKLCCNYQDQRFYYSIMKSNRRWDEQEYDRYVKNKLNCLRDEENELTRAYDRLKLAEDEITRFCEFYKESGENFDLEMIPESQIEENRKQREIIDMFDKFYGYHSNK